MGAHSIAIFVRIVLLPISSEQAVVLELDYFRHVLSVSATTHSWITSCLMLSQLGLSVVRLTDGIC